MKWTVDISQTRRRGRGRIVEGIISATLRHAAGGSHTLRGMRGIDIISATAAAWNAAKRDSPPPTRCAGDISTPAARRKFFNT